MDVCGHCPKVIHLRVRCSWAFTLASTLIDRNTFPSLVTLALHEVDFFTSLSPKNGEPLGVVLPVILRARKITGIPVRHVHLTSCVLVETWLESLREVVNDVAWDFLDQGPDLILGCHHPAQYIATTWSDDPDE